MTNTKKVLLTGENWDDRKGTTVEATPSAGKEHLIAEGLKDPICTPDCHVLGWTGVEVPYLIGDKVRTVGSVWLHHENEETTVVDYAEDGDGGWDPVLDNGYYACPGWEVEPVDETPLADWEEELLSGTPTPENDFTVGGFTGGDVVPAFLDTGYVLPLSAFKGLPPKADEHPNFIQVYVEDDGYIQSYSATRDIFASHGREEAVQTWDLGRVQVSDEADIAGYRVLLDEIERRMGS